MCERVVRPVYTLSNFAYNYINLKPRLKQIIEHIFPFWPTIQFYKSKIEAGIKYVNLVPNEVSNNKIIYKHYQKITYKVCSESKFL